MSQAVPRIVRRVDSELDDKVAPLDFTYESFDFTRYSK